MRGDSRKNGPGRGSLVGPLVGDAPTVDGDAGILYDLFSMCGPLGVFASRKNGSGDEDSPAGFWMVVASPSSGGAAVVYQWTPVGVGVMMEDGGAGIVYEYECSNGAR